MALTARQAGRESYVPGSWEVVFEGEVQFEAGLAAAGGKPNRGVVDGVKPFAIDQMNHLGRANLGCDRFADGGPNSAGTIPSARLGEV